jgi:hypothetical protein
MHLDLLLLNSLTDRPYKLSEVTVFPLFEVSSCYFSILNFLKLGLLVPLEDDVIISRDTPSRDPSMKVNQMYHEEGRQHIDPSHDTQYHIQTTILLVQMRPKISYHSEAKLQQGCQIEKEKPVDQRAENHIVMGANAVVEPLAVVIKISTAPVAGATVLGPLIDVDTAHAAVQVHGLSIWIEWLELF